GALDAAVVDDGMPIAIGFGLVFGDDLKRKGFAVLERRPAIQAQARHAHHGELDREHLPLLAAWTIAGRGVHRRHGAVRKSPGIEPGRFFRGAVIPEANYVLGHRLSPRSSVY